MPRHPRLRIQLMSKYGLRCLVSGCVGPYVKHTAEYKKVRNRLHIHRLKANGTYTHENCILICERHHYELERVPLALLLDSYMSETNPYHKHPAFS